MKYWVLENSCPGACDSHVSLWTTKEKAQQQACADIMSVIEQWDIHSSGNEDMKQYAIEINYYVGSGNYTDAIRSYNEYQAEYCDEYSDFFRVYEREVLAAADKPMLLSIIDEDEQEEDTDEYADIYNQDVSGSTCRGPCGTYNEYATPDRSDGTHICHQCKLMSNVFGGIIQ